MKQVLFAMVLALLVTGNSLYAQYQDVEEETIIEDDGFRWIEVTKYGEEYGDWTVGAKDKNGKVIIPLSRNYDDVQYSYDYDNPPFFMYEEVIIRVPVQLMEE